VQELVGNLIERFPEDADDLRDALGVMQQQRLSSVERLCKLNDNQWQRLGLPMGIETILRDEVSETLSTATAYTATPSAASSSAPARPAGSDRSGPASASASAFAPAATSNHSVGSSRMPHSDNAGEIPLEPYERSEGIRLRGPRRQEAQHEHRQNAEPPPQKGLLSPMDLSPPPDLEQLWQQLLDDTLPPDKRSSLQDSWESTPDASDRYMMFLEYSSYLRKPEVTEEEKEERRKQLEPLMREFGLKPGDLDGYEGGWGGAIFWSILIGIIFLLAGVIYYAYARQDPLQELQNL